MLVFIGELLDVQEGEYNSLVFRSTKFDRGLDKEVECSQSMGISDDCMQYMSNYKKHIGEMVAVGVTSLVTKKSTLFMLAKTDILDILELAQKDVA